MNEFFRPWKLATFTIGMSWLFWGALYLHIPDWDIGVSIIMGVLAYLTAPWSVRVILLRKFRLIPLALFAWWFTVDGAYMLYHEIAGNETFRMENFYASTTLYWLCGFIWLHQGTLRELISNRSVFLNPQTPQDNTQLAELGQAQSIKNTKQTRG